MRTFLNQASHLTRIVLALLLVLTPAVSVMGQEQGGADGKPDATFFSLPCHPLESSTHKKWLAGWGDPFQREMVRQSIFLTAREHFGLTTRDPILGEKLPDGVSQITLDYAFELKRQKPIRVSLSVDDQTLGPFTIKSQSGKIDGYLPMTWGAEAFSRGDAVDALTKLGYKPNPTKKAEPAALPETMRKRLFDMDLITQFYLARELHTQIRDEGYNLQRLTALSLVYSNLGQLTRYRLDLSSQAMHARAFLYGCRAAKLYPDRPEAYWAVNYAWMMFDLPGYGKAALKSAADANAALDQPIELPVWMPLRQLYWRYNSMALMKESRKPGPTAELAAILAVAAAETTQLNGMYRAVIENCRDVNPDTLRGYDACFAAPLWWLKGTEYGIERQERFHQSIPRVLKENQAHVPAAVQAVRLNHEPQLGEAYLDIARIAWALEDSESNTKPVELSDAALGHQLEEMLAGSAIDHYAELSMRPLGRRTDPEVWGPIIQSLQRHEYAEWFGVFRYSKLTPAELLRGPIQKTHLVDINFAIGRRLLAVAPEPYQFKNVKGFDAYLLMYYQTVQNVPGLYALAQANQTRKDYRAFSSWLHAGAPHVPLRANTYIRHDDFNEEVLKKRLDWAKHMPNALLAAAEWYEKNGRDKEGLALRIRAAVMLPDKTLVAETAQFALLMGREKDWLEMMLLVRKASKNIPPYGSIEMQIAATYMEGHKWESALQWAKEAYQLRKWDPEAIHLAWCLHKNGQTEEAIKILEERDRKTGQGFAIRFCKQLGLTEYAAVMAKDYEVLTLPRAASFDPRAEAAFKADLLICTGEPKKAIPIMREAWVNHRATNDAARLLILAEQFDDDKLHDQMLQELADNRGRDYRSSVTALMAKVIQTTPDTLPTEQEIRPVIDRYKRWSADAYVTLNFGWYLVAAGDVPAGQKLLIEVLHDKRVPIYAYERYMAAVVLRQSGYDMDKHPWRFPEAHDWEKY